MSEQPKNISCRPSVMPEQPAYSNSNYVNFGPLREVTIVFLRVPPLTEDQVEDSRRTGQLSAPVVTAVTMPPEAALALGDALRKMPEALRPKSPDKGDAP